MKIGLRTQPPFSLGCFTCKTEVRGKESPHVERRQKMRLGCQCNCVEELKEGGAAELLYRGAEVWGHSNARGGKELLQSMQQRGMKTCCSVLTPQHVHPDLEDRVIAVSLFCLCQL